jgi:hypothetical protein
MKKNYSQQILIISVLVLTISVLWAYLSIYRILYSKNKTVAVEQNNIQTVLLNPSFDQGVFEELKKRKN